MYRLLGPHVNHTRPEVVEAVARWRPAVALLMDPDPAWRRLREASPASHIVARRHFARQPDFNDNLDPIGEARNHAAQVLPWAEPLRGIADYLQGYNEITPWTPQAMARFAAFEAERVRLLAEAGWRAGIGAFSVGQPADLRLWRDFLPALQAGAAHGAALLLHQYGWPDLPGNAWLTLRHRQVYAGEPSHGWEGLPFAQRLPVILSEAGLDKGVVPGAPLLGWRTLLDDDAYLAQLAAYDQALQQDPYVLGACLYCVSSLDPAWATFDLWEEPLDRIIAQATPLYRPATPPLPPGPPVLIDLTDQLARHPTARYRSRHKDAARFTVLHHSGTCAEVPDGRAYTLAIARYHVSRGQPGISYHFTVGRDGTIYQTNRLQTVSWHAGIMDANRRGIGVCLLGNFVHTDPTLEQVRAAQSLIAWLGLPVYPHRDFVDTACPGRAMEAVRNW